MCCSRIHPYPSHGRFLSLTPPPSPTPLKILAKLHTFWTSHPFPLEFLLPFLGRVWIYLDNHFLIAVAGSVLKISEKYFEVDFTIIKAKTIIMVTKTTSQSCQTFGQFPPHCIESKTYNSFSTTLWINDFPLQKCYLILQLVTKEWPTTTLNYNIQKLFLDPPWSSCTDRSFFSQDPVLRCQWRQCFQGNR